jgi:hypothetical protein
MNFIEIEIELIFFCEMLTEKRFLIRHHPRTYAAIAEFFAQESKVPSIELVALLAEESLLPIDDLVAEICQTLSAFEAIATLSDDVRSLLDNATRKEYGFNAPG